MLFHKSFGSYCILSILSNELVLCGLVNILASMLSLSALMYSSVNIVASRLSLSLLMTRSVQLTVAASFWDCLRESERPCHHALLVYGRYNDPGSRSVRPRGHSALRRFAGRTSSTNNGS